MYHPLRMSPSFGQGRPESWSIRCRPPCLDPPRKERVKMVLPQTTEARTVWRTGRDLVTCPSLGRTFGPFQYRLVRQWGVFLYDGKCLLYGKFVNSYKLQSEYFDSGA